MLTTANDFGKTYEQIKSCTKNTVGNPYRKEYLDHLEIEREKFSGKHGVDGGSEGKSETSFSQSTLKGPNIKGAGDRAQQAALL